MKKYFKSFVLIPLLWYSFVLSAASNAVPVHPIHVSKFTLRYSVQDSGYRTTTYLFMDDLSKALSRIPGAVTDNAEIDVSRADSLIERYLRMHIHVRIDGQTSTAIWVGKELSDNKHAYWIYMFYPAKKKGILDITDNVFTEVTEEQKNIVQYYDSDGVLHEEILHKDRTQLRFNP